MNDPSPPASPPPPKKGSPKSARTERHPGTDADHPAPATPESAERVDGSDVDVLVIGGGIQGVGVAQAAAAAGARVALLERREAAIGTSSRSSKLIHGGLRYLETLQLALVRESLAERRILRQIAPHLVRLVPFHIPVYRDTSRGPWTIRAGLTLYSLLGGFRSTTRFDRVPRSAWDSLDGLTTDGLRAVFRYQDGQTDDAALCRAVLASAIELGALADAGAEVTALRRTGPTWHATYLRNGRPCTCTARTVVAAAGPWVNRVASLADPAPPTRPIDLVGGTHIELEGHLSRGIYYFEAPSDRRAVFSIPWKGRILVGTTEREYDGDPAAIAPTDAEVEYLLGVHRRYFPQFDGAPVDAWAGLRVLPRAEGSAFARPRDVVLVADDARAASWVGVYGGKLTGYRHTAEEVLALLGHVLPDDGRRADTRTLRLPELEPIRVWD